MVHLSNPELSIEIIEACRLGDRAAFRALYDHYKDRVYSISLYYFHGDAACASDVTQQVFLKLLTAITHFRGDSEFSTWLYRMVVNACNDVTRSRRASWPDVQTVPGRTQEEEYERTELERAVRNAVSALPAKFRMAVLLRYFDDLSYEEMARSLDCSIGTVSSRLSRGHKMLADRLKKLRAEA